MASRSLLLSSFLLLFVCLSTSTAFTGKRKKLHQLQPCKRFVLYHHDISYNGENAENATSTIIAAPKWAKKTMLANQLFGSLVVFDSPVTLDSDRHSSQVGRAQGFYTYDDMEIYSVWISFSVHLDSEEYKGTINFAGADLAINETSDISVLGGTGDFFMTRGIATLGTDAYDEGLAYTRLKVDIKLYECWQVAPDA